MAKGKVRSFGSVCRCCQSENCGKRKASRNGKRGSVQPTREAKIRLYGAEAMLPPYPRRDGRIDYAARDAAEKP